MTRIESFIWKSSFIVFVFTVNPVTLPYGKGGSEGREFADPLITFLTREVVPRVQSKVKGDLLKGCERGAGRA